MRSDSVDNSIGLNCRDALNRVAIQRVKLPPLLSNRSNATGTVFPGETGLGRQPFAKILLEIEHILHRCDRVVRVLDQVGPEKGQLFRLLECQRLILPIKVRRLEQIVGFHRKVKLATAALLVFFVILWLFGGKLGPATHKCDLKDVVIPFFSLLM